MVITIMIIMKIIMIIKTTIMIIIIMRIINMNGCHKTGECDPSDIEVRRLHHRGSRSDETKGKLDIIIIISCLH